MPCSISDVQAVVNGLAETCSNRSAQYPANCLSELQQGRYEGLAALASRTFIYSINVDFLYAVDLVCDYDPEVEALINPAFPFLVVDLITVQGSTFWPKSVGSIGNILGGQQLNDQRVVLPSLRRPYAYGYGQGTGNAATPLSSIIQSTGPVSLNSSINVRVTNTSTTTAADIPSLNLIMFQTAYSAAPSQQNARP